MAVAVVGTPAAQYTATVGAGGDTTDVSTTGGASCNFVIGVAYWFDVPTTSVPTGRIGGSSTGVTMIGSVQAYLSDSHRLAWWYKLNPGSGALAFDVSFSGSVDEVYTGVIAFSGVDTSTPLGTEPTFATGNSTAPSITIAGGGANDMNVAWAATKAADTDHADGTEAFSDATGGDRTLVLEYLSGAGQQMDFTQTVALWGVRGIEVLAAGSVQDTQEWRGSHSVGPRGQFGGHVVY